MKIYFNGFWSGFHEHTNAVNDIFFVNLMKEVYNNCEISYDIDISDILIENTQCHDSVRNYKKWRNTYLYSGESYIRSDKADYDCVLFGNRNHKNIVNVPLYLPYYISSFDETYITENKKSNITSIPENEVLVIVSNPGGEIRNQFMNELEKHFKITYAGNFKNNIGYQLSHYYNTQQFRDYVGKFKFVFAIENSEEDTYITEKITHGLLSGSIPIYWGSKRVSDYFSSDRFLEIKDNNDFDNVIQTMKNMNDDEWLRRVNLEPFTEFGKSYTVKTVANHIKNLLLSKPFPKLTSLYMICNKDYEPVRYNKLVKMCEDLGFNDYNYNYICPTFKHTITDEIMKKYVRGNRIFSLRSTQMRKSEISLYLNFEAVWEHIIKTYSDGIFLILEADAFVLPDIKYFNNCLSKLENKEWSGINISGCNGRICNFNKNESYVTHLLHRCPLSSEHQTFLENNCIEDLSSSNDIDVRFMRKYHTRCTDSQLWSYNGCCQMLHKLHMNNNYDIPMDYYFTSIFEDDVSVKYYWSDDTYFNQASTSGIDISTIQNDII